MVAHFTMRTHGVNQAIRFFEGIWFQRKSRNIRFCFSEKDLDFIIRAQREMSNHLYKNHGSDQDLKTGSRSRSGSETLGVSPAGLLQNLRFLLG